MGSQIEADRLNELIQHLGSSEQDLISRRAGALYHYTDLRAMVSIIENGDLWLTNSLFSNDAEEMNHGRNIARQVIESRPLGGGRTRATFLELVTKSLDESQSEEVYICCFCDEPNLLSQWRGYGANGGGVAIQFKAGEFSAITGPDCPVGLMRFWRIYYQEAKQRQRILEILSFWYHRKELELTDRARFAADGIRFFVPTFKHADFEQESEWRLIFTPGANCPVPPRYRLSRGMLAPYYSLLDISKASGAQFPLLPISEICIGPSTSKELNRKSTEMLLRQSNYSCAVVVSETPLRA